MGPGIGGLRVSREVERSPRSESLDGSNGRSRTGIDSDRGMDRPNQKTYER